MSVPNVTQKQITNAVRALGVAPVDCLLVHSSLKSFGHVEGGAQTVVNALLECASTVVMPTFNYDRFEFDPITTPSLTGAITEAFRKAPGATRSLHPTHSVCAIGPLAKELCRGHENTHPFGEASPLWKLWKRNGQILLIGVDHRASSM